MKVKLWIVLLLLLLAACWHLACSNTTTASEAAQISYNFQIRPILSDKCFSCHGPDANKRQAGLRLDIGDSALAPLKETKGAFALVPGHPEQSELYKRINSNEAPIMMPPPESHLGKLTEAEIVLIKNWIEQGAKYEKHWAFIAPKKAPLPTIKDKQWPVNEIDYFIAQKMEQQGLEPNPVADKERLLKRLSFDITGLPPAETLQQKFWNSNNADAYEKTIDELLATPQYGEKMAVHWLDVGRYADSYGYQDDNIRTQWPWRDWVIHAFNKNLPYNDFVTWQLAGDMLPDATKEQVLATAFLRNHKYTEEGGVIPEEYRVEYLVDKTKTYTKGILGVTLECAQCHDHKYDPFPQQEYYATLAFFNNSKEQGYEGDVSVSKPAKYPILKINDSDVNATLRFINKKDTGTITVSVMAEDTLRKTYILNRGVYDKPTTQVKAAPLSAVLPFDTLQYPANRLGLAQWTTDASHPLTARVFVNQVWQEIFGRGLVKTPGDFGMQGELPSHPELLDWLARDFIEQGWNIKQLLKKILMSATYRQSAAISNSQLAKDPENIYLSRGPRNRLKAEFVRDHLLASSGLLQPAIGGPSVKPYQPKGLWEASTSGRGVLAKYKQDKGELLYRRGLYTFIKLTAPPPGMIMFDASNRDQCETIRSKTNTPLQALVMMNDPTMLEAARYLGYALLKEPDAAKRINIAFRRIICRSPAAKEQATLLNYYQQQLTAFAGKQLDAKQTVQIGETPLPATQQWNEWAALSKTIALIYNLEEAITKS
jgi:hypothetical protein